MIALLTRPEDGHKGTFGHAMIIAGQYGMTGASILAAKACLRSGVGKVTVHIPTRNNDILQVAVPEAILEHDKHPLHYSSPSPLLGINAVAIGPGLGTHEDAANALKEQLSGIKNLPLVLDADALNILSEHPSWIEAVPPQSILTPHGGELARLLSATGLSIEAFVERYQVHLVAKGHPTIVHHPGGAQHICNKGNNGMATAGSGDVLTGIIVALLAQGYAPAEAAELGVTLHAMAGDLAAQNLGTHSLIASDIIDYLPKAFLSHNTL